MRCYKCRAEYTEELGSLSLSSTEIGPFEVHNVVFYKCSSCMGLLFPRDTALKIEEKETESKRRLISSFPVTDFISGVEACKILNISKQAFQKNRRIRKGWIYSFDFFGKKLFLKRSVILFKEKNDGRFSLNPVQTENPHFYIASPNIKQNELTYVVSNRMLEPPQIERQITIEKSLYLI